MFIFIFCVFVEVTITFGNNVYSRKKMKVYSQISKSKRKKRKEVVENEIYPFEALIRMTFLTILNTNIDFRDLSIHLLVDNCNFDHIFNIILHSKVTRDLWTTCDFYEVM